jgi:GMP reductase
MVIRKTLAHFVSEVREKFPEKVIMAGNVATYEMTEQLILSGADVVKVGIGPGAVCTTRTKTGVGVPQLTAVIECSDAAHSLGGQIIADGGIVDEGDVAKAFGGGADFVMIGSMFAAHQECEEPIVYEWNNNDWQIAKYDLCNDEWFTHEGDLPIPNSNLYVEFYGMSSERAKSKHGARKDGYRGAEGKVVRIPYRGPIDDTITQLLGHVCSTCTMIGARRVKDIPKCTVFNVVRQRVNDSLNRYNI